VLALIARRTEHTRALVRRQLAELESLAPAPEHGDTLFQRGASTPGAAGPRC